MYFFLPIFRIQDLDGGFFEKFGSLFQQQSQIADVPLAIATDPILEGDKDEGQSSNVVLSTIDEREDDSGIEIQAPESDGETENFDQTLKEQIMNDLVGASVSSC